MLGPCFERVRNRLLEGTRLSQVRVSSKPALGDQDYRAKHAMFILCPTFLLIPSLTVDQEVTFDKRIGPALPG